VYIELQKNMFLALRKRTNSAAPLVSNVQSEPNQTTYSYAQAVKTALLQNINKQNNADIKRCTGTANKRYSTN